MNINREQAYFFVSMTLVVVALISAMTREWATFAPAIVGAMGYWLAMAEVKAS